MAGSRMRFRAGESPEFRRMPTLLSRHEQELWLRGSMQDVNALQFGKPIAADRMDIIPTKDRWLSGKVPDMWCRS